MAIDKEEEKLTTLIKMSSSSSAEGQLRELDAFVKKAHPEVQFHARERIFDLCRKELGKHVCAVNSLEPLSFNIFMQRY